MISTHHHGEEQLRLDFGQEASTPGGYSRIHARQSQSDIHIDQALLAAPEDWLENPATARWLAEQLR